MNGEFDRNATLVVDCKNLGVFKQKGTYPTADEPHVFRDKDDCADEIAIMGMKRKTGLTVEDYPRTTNILESRLLLNYTGNNPELIEAQGELYAALINGIEKKLAYELESNCITQDELDSSNAQINRMFGYMARIKRPAVLTEEDEIKVPDPVEDVDGII